MSDHQPGCDCCRAALDPADFDIRSTDPDPILALSDEERAAVQGGRSLRLAEGVGAFVRCLMPVRLTGGSRVTYSVWLEIDPEALRHAREVWQAPAYADLAFTGTVANAIKPWAPIYGEPATAEVQDADSLPYLVASEGTLLWRVLNEEWDRDEVLSRIAHALPTTVHNRVTAAWSLDRTAGLRVFNRKDGLVFAGPGRTVLLNTFTMPAGASPAECIALFTEDAPADRDEVLTEQDGDVVRHTYRTPPVSHHEVYGLAAAPGGDLILALCMFDDPDDLGWAHTVWRSLRHHDV
ncbi:DUF2199 domain-containing protein [Actinoplanes sp. HUAS TT8]|uniref:DUF2199 domain-containing protein n=1 Tax=Actinoplanes sp. HUAS TT8 TaxID=3447453 RepID=UPI003F521E11